jgi:hypothetical protein
MIFCRVMNPGLGDKDCLPKIFFSKAVRDGGGSVISIWS